MNRPTATISMRGDFGEGNPWQMPMGRAVEPVLEAMGVMCVRVDDAGEAADNRRNPARQMATPNHRRGR